MNLRSIVPVQTRSRVFAQFDRAQRRVLRAPRVASIDETIDRLLTTRCSMVRFGDGEMTIMKGQSIQFQDYSPDLHHRLVDVLRLTDPNLAVCIPDTFGDLSQYTPPVREFFEAEMGRSRRKWLSLTDPTRLYYNAFVSRLYMDHADKTKSAPWFAKIRGLWSGRDVTIVEGGGSRLGVGNDLFDDARSIERILCPSRNAFAAYGRIRETVAAGDRGRLVIVALGPTAKLLVSDLHQAGFWAVDLGHIDVEYEWFLMGAERKVKIAGKHVNEAKDGQVFEDVDSAVYRHQIVARIEEA